MSAEKAKELGVKPLAAILAGAAAGVDPRYMGMGPVAATKKLLSRLTPETGLKLSDFGLVEINEAFAAQTLACAQELGIDQNKLNVNGGGISLGHPVGATGSRIVITLMNELAKRHGRYGLATLCAGGGMGTTVIIEVL